MTTLQAQSDLCLDILKLEFLPLTDPAFTATVVGIECGLSGMTQSKQFESRKAPNSVILGWEDISLVAIGLDSSTSASEGGLRVYTHASHCSRDHDGNISGGNTKSTRNHAVTGLAGPFPLAPLQFEGNYVGISLWQGAFACNELGEFVNRLRVYDASGAAETPTLYTVQVETFNEDTQETYREYVSFIALSDVSARPIAAYS